MKEGPVFEVYAAETFRAADHFFTAEYLDLLKAIVAVSMYEVSVAYLDEETWKTEGITAKAGPCRIRSAGSFHVGFLMLPPAGQTLVKLLLPPLHSAVRVHRSHKDGFNITSINLPHNDIVSCEGGFF